MKRWTRSDLHQSFLSVIIGFVSLADVILFIVWRLGPRINAIWIATLFLAIGNGEIALFRPRLLLAYARNKKAFTSTEIRVTAIAHFAVAGLIGFSRHLSAASAIGILLLAISIPAFVSVYIHWREIALKMSLFRIGMNLVSIAYGILFISFGASAGSRIFIAMMAVQAIASVLYGFELRQGHQERQFSRDAHTTSEGALSPLGWGIPPSHPRRRNPHSSAKTRSSGLNHG